jgi:nitrate reductase cytochrome c-type subunit
MNSYWLNESFYIVLTDHIKANTSKLINNTSSYIYACLPCDVPKLNIKDLLVNVLVDITGFFSSIKALIN